MNNTVSNFILFGFCLLLQVVVLNNILVFGYINPYLYIAFIFLFPINSNLFVFYSLSFLLGLSIDFFLDSGGIHASASLFIAYIRLPLFKRFFQKSENEYESFKLQNESLGSVLNYVIILTITHHFILFSLANFSFSNISYVLINTVLSSIFTILLYFLGSFILNKND